MNVLPKPHNLLNKHLYSLDTWTPPTFTFQLLFVAYIDVHVCMYTMYTVIEYL